MKCTNGRRSKEHGSNGHGLKRRERRLKRDVLITLILLPVTLLGCRSANQNHDQLITSPPPTLPEVALVAFSDDNTPPDNTSSDNTSSDNKQNHPSDPPATHPSPATQTSTMQQAAEIIADDITMRAALSHANFTRSIPDHLILKVDLSAASTTPRTRKPLNLALVFDRSGSMADDRKFNHAMRAANIVFENLSDHDIVSLIAFNQKPSVLSPAGRAVNKDFLRFRLRQFGPTGDTNLSAAILEAFAQIESKNAEGQMKRVILLTDGLANRGITDPEKLRKLVAAAHERGIGVSTLGCGTEFSEEVLSSLAKAGGGRYTYVRSGEQIPTAVSAELNGLLDVLAQNAKIDVRATAGASITRVYGRFLTTPTPSYSFELGDMRDGERGSFLLELTPGSFDTDSSAGADITITLDNPETGKRNKYTIHAESTFTANPEDARSSTNKNVQVYANIINAMEKAEEAIQGRDIQRFKEAHDLFGRYYEIARKHAIQTRDQQLLNQTFLLRHFMADLSDASAQTPMHGHDDAQKQLRKGADYRRYLLEHHRPQPAPQQPHQPQP